MPIPRVDDSGAARIFATTTVSDPERNSIVSIDRRGLVKINPLANWTDFDVAGYIDSNELLYNPLLDRGYPSIGCMPTTQPVAPGDHHRAGRWAGTDKTECGIHD